MRFVASCRPQSGRRALRAPQSLRSARQVCAVAKRFSASRATYRTLITRYSAESIITVYALFLYPTTVLFRRRQRDADRLRPGLHAPGSRIPWWRRWPATSAAGSCGSAAQIAAWGSLHARWVWRACVHHRCCADSHVASQVVIGPQVCGPGSLIGGTAERARRHSERCPVEPSQPQAWCHVLACESTTACIQGSPRLPGQPALATCC